MKSKFSTILIVVILLVVGLLIYFFVIRGDKAPAAETGLVSANTGTAQGLQNTNTTTGTSTTGSAVVQILRNLSSIQLDDSVFRNPAFAYLVDMTLQLPPATNQGRRNPFAPIGSEGSSLTAPAATTTTSTTTGTGTGFAPTTGQ